MASIFTYDPDPPKLVSPWGEDSLASTKEPSSTHASVAAADVATKRPIQLGGLPCPPPRLIANCDVSMLREEPQDGPVEYKLHLLLRPRRSFSVLSTSSAVSGSYHLQPRPWYSEGISAHEPMTKLQQTSIVTVPSLQARQNRLQNLTTQLLWRLQQSSPYHSQSTANLILPRLPEATFKLGTPTRPEKLLPGLEESHGALYEIGVSDDGTFVGLSVDEMSESLANLRAMAASLGCNVQILRCVIVGHCEWIESASAASEKGLIRKDALFVTEALVFPDTSSKPEGSYDLLARASSAPILHGTASAARHESTGGATEISRTEQLRVSLTGRSAAGKSSLLGTLTTSTYDNGRGKSRLSLLKHRHEIASGMTSSVASELIGYSPAQNEGSDSRINVINYGYANVSSWDGIHNTTGEGRLVFLTDSAGHPRFRRTTVRGLVSWAPHWTLCCIAANDESHRSSSPRMSAGEDSSGQDILATGSSFAHLELCLQMDLSLVVIVTKHDRATREGLRHTLSIILSMIKAYYRKPVLLVKPRTPHRNHDLQSFSTEEQEEVLAALRDEPDAVPILMTSAVSGSGISKVHALLSCLPVPRLFNEAQAPLTDTLFHVDEVYSLTSRSAAGSQPQSNDGIIVASGYLKYGTLSVGDHVNVGPFTIEQSGETSKAPMMQRTRSNPSRGSSSPIPRLSQSMPRDENVRHFTPPPATPTPVVFRGEFQSAQVTSLRNLRLPVKLLRRDQAGTVGIRFTSSDAAAITKLRKGMVILRTRERPTTLAVRGNLPTIPSYAAVRVRFSDEDYHIMEPGALFNLYVASIRATTKIVAVEAVGGNASSQNGRRGSASDFKQIPNAGAVGMSPSHEESQFKRDIEAINEEQFGLDDNLDNLSLNDQETTNPRAMIDVIFRFLSAPEWVELGAKVLAMPGHAVEGGVGLEGFVGHIIEAIE